MKLRVRLLLLPLLVAAIAASADSSADTVFLDADFNDKTIDAPIGEGGPDLGEPIRVDPHITAIVRDAPMATPCLEIQDVDDYYGGSAAYEFVGSAEITTGIAAITCHLWFPYPMIGCDYYVIVREQGGYALRFADVFFNDDGTIRYSDEDSSEREIGTYAFDEVVALAIVFDLDAGTCEIRVNDELLVDGESHGVQDRGVGKVSFGCVHDADLVGWYAVDDILVSDTYTPAPVEPATWGRIKTLFE